MRIKILAFVFSLVLMGCAALAQAVCSSTDQIAPNPNASGNTLTLTSSTACNAADPYENRGTLNNAGTLNNDGALRNSTGTLNNIGTLNNEGSINSGSLFSNSGTLNNKGEISSLSSSFSNSGTVNNDGFFMAEGTTNHGTWTNNGEMPVGGRMQNFGVFVNNGSSNGQISNRGVLYNNGTMGTVFFSNSGSVFNAGQMVSFSDVVNNSGQFSILAGGEVRGIVGERSYFQTSGKTTVDGTMNMNAVNINGGVLGGSGVITAAVTIDGGKMAVGNSPGKLTIIGNYTQTMAGSFEAEIGGRVQGVEYDYLSVSGTAFLDGLLDVSRYDLGSGLFSPTLGDTFDILSAETIVGMYSNLSLAALNTGLGWQVSYLTDLYGTKDVVRLQVTALPEPEIYAMMLTGLGIMGFVARRRRKAS